MMKQKNLFQFGVLKTLLVLMCAAFWFPSAQAAWYMHGSCPSLNGGASLGTWQLNHGWGMIEDNGTFYAYDITFPASNDIFYFFSANLGSYDTDWTTVNSSRYGPSADQTWIDIASVTQTSTQAGRYNNSYKWWKDTEYTCYVIYSTASSYNNHHFVINNELYLVGEDAALGGWDWDDCVTLTYDSNGLYKASNVTISADSKFIFSALKVWNGFRFSPTSGTTNISANSWVQTSRCTQDVTNEGNYKIAAGTYDVTFDMKTRKFEFAKKIDDLYIIGNVNGNVWNPAVGVQMTETSSNVFTARHVYIENGNEFAFSASLGSAWDDIRNDRVTTSNASTWWITSAQLGTALSVTGPASRDNINFRMDAGSGYYDIVVDMSAKTVTFTASSIYTIHVYDNGGLPYLYVLDSNNTSINGDEGTQLGTQIPNTNVETIGVLDGWHFTALTADNSPHTLKFTRDNSTVKTFSNISTASDHYFYFDGKTYQEITAAQAAQLRQVNIYVKRNTPTEEAPELEIDNNGIMVTDGTMTMRVEKYDVVWWYYSFVGVSGNGIDITLTSPTGGTITSTGVDADGTEPNVYYSFDPVTDTFTKLTEEEARAEGVHNVKVHLAVEGYVEGKTIDQISSNAWNSLAAYNDSDPQIVNGWYTIPTTSTVYIAEADYGNQSKSREAANTSSNMYSSAASTTYPSGVAQSKEGPFQAFNVVKSDGVIKVADRDWYTFTYNDQRPVGDSYNVNIASFNFYNDEVVSDQIKRKSGELFYIWDPSNEGGLTDLTRIYLDYPNEIPAICTMLEGHYYVYYINSKGWDNVSLYCWKGTRGVDPTDPKDKANGVWPGAPCTKVGSYNGYDVYLFDFGPMTASTFGANDGNLPNLLIFNDGTANNAEQTSDYDFKNGGVYDYLGLRNGAQDLVNIIQTGIVNGPSYTVADDLIGVWYDDDDPADPGVTQVGALYAKDQGNKYPNLSVNRYGDIDYCKTCVTGQEGRDYDQSNWVKIKASYGYNINLASYVGKEITGGTMSGNLVNNVNPEMHITEIAEKGNKAYTKNVYITCNMMGNRQKSPKPESQGYGAWYYFVTPKPQEVAEVAWAVYAGDGKFFVPVSVYNAPGTPAYSIHAGWSNEPDLNGGFQADWTLFDSSFGKGKGATGANATFQVGEAYKMPVVIRVPESSLGGAPRRTNSIGYKEEDESGNSNLSTLYKVFVIDADPSSGVVTGIDHVDNARRVSSVQYINMQGAVSEQPFEGFNVMVTRYSDGTVRTAKIFN